MLPEMKWIQGDLIPMLRQRADHTQRAAKAQLEVWAARAAKPLLLLNCPHPDAQKLPVYPLDQIHWDWEKMLVNELRRALGAIAGGQAAVPSVRANAGCGIYPTLFGMQQRLFPDMMPWIKDHLSVDRVRAMTREDLALSPEFKEALHQMRCMKQVLHGAGIPLYPLDLQGTVDIAHLVIGDSFFYQLYDDPDFTAHLMDLSGACIQLGCKEVLQIIDPADGFVAHYSEVVLPADRPLKTSEDTTTLISRDHIERYALPSTKQILDTFGGGYMHYCGKNDALFELFLNEPLYIGLNFGNPEKHDMDDVLAKTAAAGKTFYGAVDQKPGETLYDYFSRAIKSSTAPDGTAHLLLSYSCPIDDRPRVLDTWEKAGGGIVE